MKTVVSQLVWRLLGAVIGLVAGGALGLFIGKVTTQPAPSRSRTD